MEAQRLNPGEAHGSTKQYSHETKAVQVVGLYVKPIEAATQSEQ